MNNYISYYESSKEVKASRRMTITAFMKGVKNGEWETYATRAQSLAGKKLSNYKRNMVPAVTISGTFKAGRTDDDLDQPSFFVCIDVDNVVGFKKNLQKDPYVCGYFRSISGKGLAIIFKIRKPKKHRNSYEAISSYLMEKYNIEVDPACKNISRIRFVSYDPSSYFAPNRKQWFEVEDRKPEAKAEYENYDMTEIEELVDTAVKRKVDLMEGYHVWYRIGQALAMFGEKGRELFHRLSRVNKHEYNESVADKQFDACLAQEASGNRDVRVGPGTLYYIAKEKGVLLKSGPTYVSGKNRA